MMFPSIEAERARMGISKDELAKRLGIDRKTLHNWQTGKTQLPVSKVIEMAGLFNCPTDYLLGLVSQPRERAG